MFPHDCQDCSDIPRTGDEPLNVLLLDIETAPNLAYVWDLWDQNVGLNQLVNTTEMMCFAAKWLGEREMFFHSTHADGQKRMVKAAHRLLNEADVVMHYNGRRFDVPHLNREFLQAGLHPPAPYQQIDLWQVVKRRFKFPSTKLEHVSNALGLTGKVKHEGFALWTQCMAGDAAAWKRMEKYNRQDVNLLEELYGVVQPWIPSHPNRNLFTDVEVCGRCGAPASMLQRRGTGVTLQSKFQRWHCKACGGWFHSTRRLEGVTKKEASL